MLKDILNCGEKERQINIIMVTQYIANINVYSMATFLAFFSYTFFWEAGSTIGIEQASENDFN